MDIKNEDLCYILLRLNICFIVCCVANGNVALNAWEMLEKDVTNDKACVTIK